MMLLQSSELRRLFDEFDGDRNGQLDLHELQLFLKLVGVDAGPEELKKIVGTSSFDLKEFEALCKGRAQEEMGDDHGDNVEPMEAFKVFDEDGDGFISSKEVERVLVRVGLWKEGDGDCTKMICKFIADKDGRLDFQQVQGHDAQAFVMKLFSCFV